MGRLNILVSVPHAGLEVPPEAAPYCILSAEEIAEDGDVGAAEVYSIEDEVRAFVTTGIARAIVDMNRDVSDRGRDGVVKTHTCWEVQVYEPFPPEETVDALLRTYYRSYHAELTRLSSGGVRLGVDCHTMCAVGPPVAADAGVERPWVCLSNADGTCPEEWLEDLKQAFSEEFDGSVMVNHPFRGGHIVRAHAGELPWVQLELSRAPFCTDAEKRDRVLRALERVSLG